jgi:hypothetical protein
MQRLFVDCVYGMKYFLEEKKMNSNQKSRLAIGVLFLLGGLFLLALIISPELKQFVHITASWPLIIIGVGVFLAVLGLLLAAPGMLVPACILGGIGGLLYWQNLTGNWASWAYAWTLIPGFSGVGQVLAGLLGSSEHRVLQKGLWQILVSLLLFVIFGSFLGGLTWLGPFWPLMLVLAGIIIIVRNVVKNRE